MTIPQDVNNSDVSLQDVLPQEPLERRQAFRIWQLTRDGKSYPVLGKLLGGLTASRVCQMVADDRMPEDYHKILVENGVPERLLPIPEDSPLGARTKSRRE